MKRHGKKLIIYSAIVLLVVYLCLCFSMRLSTRDTSFTEDDYMLYYIVNAEDTEAFLQTGDFHIDGDQLNDNYDYALYRPITAENYNTILEQAVPYLEAELQFAALYEEWAWKKSK